MLGSSSPSGVLPVGYGLLAVAAVVVGVRGLLLGVVATDAMLKVRNPLSTVCVDAGQVRDLSLSNAHTPQTCAGQCRDSDWVWRVGAGMDGRARGRAAGRAREGSGQFAAGTSEVVEAACPCRCGTASR